MSRGTSSSGESGIDRIPAEIRDFFGVDHVDAGESARYEMLRQSAGGNPAALELLNLKSREVVNRQAIRNLDFILALGDRMTFPELYVDSDLRESSYSISYYLNSIRLQFEREFVGSPQDIMPDLSGLRAGYVWLDRNFNEIADFELNRGSYSDDTYAKNKDKRVEVPHVIVGARASLDKKGRTEVLLLPLFSAISNNAYGREGVRIARFVHSLWSHQSGEVYVRWKPQLVQAEMTNEAFAGLIQLQDELLAHGLTDDEVKAAYSEDGRSFTLNPERVPVFRAKDTSSKLLSICQFPNSHTGLDVDEFDLDITSIIEQDGSAGLIPEDFVSYKVLRWSARTMMILGREQEFRHSLEGWKKGLINDPDMEDLVQVYGQLGD